jgi:hypothetical protein
MPARTRPSRVAEILLASGLVDEVQLRSVHAHQAQWGGRMTRIIVDLGFADMDAVASALAAALGTQVVHLGRLPRDRALLAKLDAAYCEEHAVFPFELRDRALILAMADPTELDVIDAVQARYGARVVPALASELEIENAIRVHYRGLPPRKFSDRARRAVSRAEFQAPPGALELDTSRPPPFATQETQARDLLDALTAEGQLGEEELARLEAARVNQDKMSTILRAVTALLTEKGVLG